VIVIGGGAIGSSVGFHLKLAEPNLRVCVVERDPTYKIASSPLSVGSIRQQFSIPENTAMSMYTAKFLKGIQFEYDPSLVDPIHFEESGYLVLGSPRSEEGIRENHKSQLGQEAKVALLNPSELEEKFPWLNTNGIAVGSFGYENEGWFDPYSMMMWFKKHGISMGVNFVDGEVIAINHNSNDKDVVVQSPGTVTTFDAPVVVNAGGCWARQIASLAGIEDVPIVAKRRRVFIFHCPEDIVRVEPGVPMVFDPVGLWVRREGNLSAGTFVCGMAAGDDPDLEGTAEELEPGENDSDFFENYMWEPLATRIPAFENIRVTGGWQGFYDFNTLDENAIIGEAPQVPGFYFVAGFSGHGIQHTPAVGLAISELILKKRYDTFDLSRFGFERILKDEPFREAVCY